MNNEYLTGAYRSKNSENQAWREKLTDKVQGRRAHTGEERELVRDTDPVNSCSENGRIY